jgi:hypothetical protein
MTFKQEVELFDSVFKQLSQAEEYNALAGPNSNTYAMQLLMLAAEKGGFKLPNSPSENRKSCDYKGTHWQNKGYIDTRGSTNTEGSISTNGANQPLYTNNC